MKTVETNNYLQKLIANKLLGENASHMQDCLKRYYFPK